MAKVKEARGFVWLKCNECNRHTYRAERRLKGQVTKIELKKFCKYCRKHTAHSESRKK